MLLKIEYTTGGSSASQQSSQSTNATTTQVLHVNFATASHHTDGILFNVGRKKADVIFENERSVSRSHCSLRIISSGGAKKTKKKASDNQNHPKTPETDEEVQACDEAADGLVAVLDDLGSKFGTKVYMEKQTTSKSNLSDDDDNDSTTDDETDDEGGAGGGNTSQFSRGANSQSGGSAGGGGVGILLQGPNQIVKPLEKNGSIILAPLSLHPHEESSSSLSSSPSPPLSVTVQCGNAYFKITRIPLEFCTSRIQAKEKKEIESLLPTIGATLSSTFECNTITHLITPDRISTAKSISAWALNVPIVTSDYVKALAERTDAKDVLPQGCEEEYASPGEMGMDEELETNPSKRKYINAGYKMLSLQPIEGEVLMCATGATIVKLYRQVNGKEDVKFWQTDEFWDELVEEQKKDGLYVVWMDSAKRNLKKGRDFILKKMKKHAKDNDGFKIATINQIGTATSISQGSNLSSVDGLELVPLKEITVPSDEREVSMKESGSEVDQSVPAESENKVQMPQPTGTMKMKEGTQDGDEAQEEAIEFQHEPDPDPIPEPEPAHEPEPEPKPAHEDGAEISSRSKKRKQISEPPPPSSQSGWVSSQSQVKAKPKRASQNVNHIENEMEVDDNNDIEHEEGPDQNDRKPRLPETKDGWMCSAPQGKERNCYKRTREEMCQYGELPEHAEESAETEVISLIVRSKKDVKEMKRAQSQSSKNRKSNGRKDFKRFKKNSISKFEGFVFVLMQD